MIHWSTYPNSSPHTHTNTNHQLSHTHINHQTNLYDVDIKPHLLHMLIKERVPGDKHPFENPTELSTVVSLIKTHGHLSKFFSKSTDQKLVNNWKSAIDSWVKHVLLLISNNMGLRSPSLRGEWLEPAKATTPPKKPTTDALLESTPKPSSPQPTSMPANPRPTLSPSITHPHHHGNPPPHQTHELPWFKGK